MEITRIDDDESNSIKSQFMKLGRLYKSKDKFRVANYIDENEKIIFTTVFYEENSCSYQSTMNYNESVISLYGTYEIKFRALGGSEF